MARLARHVTVAVCVDDEGNLEDLDRAASRAGSSVGVMVELNTAPYRAGIPAGDPLLRLVDKVSSARSVEFMGIQAYNGAVQHIRDHPSRQDAAERAIALVADAVDLLARNGIRCEVVSGGGPNHPTSIGGFRLIEPPGKRSDSVYFPIGMKTGTTPQLMDFHYPTVAIRVRSFYPYPPRAI